MKTEDGTVLLDEDTCTVLFGSYVGTLLSCGVDSETLRRAVLNVTKVAEDLVLWSRMVSSVVGLAEAKAAVAGKLKESAS